MALPFAGVRLDGTKEPVPSTGEASKIGEAARRSAAVRFTP